MEAINVPQQQNKWSYSLFQVFTTTVQGLKERIQGKNHKDIEESYSSQSEVTDMALPADGSKEVNKQLSSNNVKLSSFGDVCELNCNNQSMLDSRLNAEQFFDRDTYPQSALNFHLNDKPATAEGLFNCGICKAKCYSLSMLNIHLKLEKHTAQLKKLKKVYEDRLNKLANDKPASSKLFFNCGICKVKCYHESTVSSHLNGKKHKAHLEAHLEKLNNKPASSKLFFNCSICKVKCYHESTVNSHLNGKKHKAHLEAPLEKLNKVQDDKLFSPESANKLANNKPATAEQLFNCGICKAKCHSQSILISHLNGKKHMAKVPNTLLPHEALFKMKAAEENPLKVESDDDEECYEIDPIIFTRKLAFDDMDDVALVAEKGPVALRDFPHPRHLCGCLPFGTTSHESFCPKCFCCVCEVVAPCTQWKGINGHCHLSEKIRSEV